jgi:hypothetical protein
LHAPAKRLKKALATMLLLAVLVLAMLVAPASSGAFTGHGCTISTCRFFTSSYSNARYFYDRRTCDQWKSLSRKYLHGFKSKTALKNRFNRKLHPPC